MISASAAMTGSYDYLQVVLSVVIAISASYAALDLGGRVTAASGWVRRAWLIGVATAMGFGIWSMHFTGMLAFRLPVLVSYSCPTVLLSVLVAIVPALPSTTIASESFMASAVVPGLSHAASVSSLGNAGILIVTLIVLVTVVLTSAVDRRLASQRADLERGRELATINEELRKEMLERQRAEDALRRSEDQLRLVIDTIPALVWSASPDGSLDFLNQRWLEYTGISSERGLGWAWAEELHPEDREGFVNAWRSAVATGEPFEHDVRVRRADGEYRWFSKRAVPLRDELGHIVKW